MNLVLKNEILDSTNSYHGAVEKIKTKIGPIFKDVVNTFRFEKKASLTLPSINLQFNYDNMSVEHYHTISHTYNINIDSLRQNLLSYFIPSRITNTILNEYVYYNQYDFTYKDRKIMVHFFNNTEEFDYRLLTTIISKGFTFLEYSKSSTKYVEFYYIPTHFKKTIPHEGGVLGPNNVNSAFTSFNQDSTGNRIVIFRKEEDSKVFIHELVHYAKMDFCFEDQSIINKAILRTFDVEGDKFINLFEAYTDAVAIIYNSIFNSLLLNISVSELLNNELDYQYTLTSKILEYYDMTHILTSKNKTSNKLIQKSNILSYYFIKYGLLDNTDKFIRQFKLNTVWTQDKIREIYTQSISSLKKKKFKINNTIPVADSRMRMTYNNINVI